jgi:G:T/U-mismatch repair DNA glycosylase
MIETHPLQPFVPEGAELLMLGSFPPQQMRWSMDFYYPNWQNDMWRIFGLIFFEDKGHFLVPGCRQYKKEELIEFLTEKRIALSDTAAEVVRLEDNASDKHLQVVETVDLKALLDAMPNCRAIAVTGQKALETLMPLVGVTQEPAIGASVEFEWEGRKLRLYRMPSTSRAYPKPIEEKAVYYWRMFNDVLK